MGQTACLRTDGPLSRTLSKSVGAGQASAPARSPAFASGQLLTE